MQKKREYKLHEKNIIETKNMNFDLSHNVKEQKIKKEDILNSIKKLGKEVEEVLVVEKLKIIDFDEMEVKDDKIQSQIKKMTTNFNSNCFLLKQLNH